ncbi:hypothetical protein FVER14953_21697 [Fusarium verticillioides]|nr:hypothetical protein FVER14953_21697 [Fusarium verticillioides]
MFAPSEDLPKTYGSMTSPQDSTTTSTHEDLSPTDNGKLEPAQTSAKKSLEGQIDDLPATLRDIWSFVLPAFPGATSLSFVSWRNGSSLPELLLEATPPRSVIDSMQEAQSAISRRNTDIDLPHPLMFGRSSTSLQNGSAMRIMKTLFDVVCHITAFLY